MLRHRKSSFCNLFRMFLAGVLLFNSIVLGAIRRGTEASSGTTTATIGIRFANDEELYFGDCYQIDAAVYQ